MSAFRLVTRPLQSSRRHFSIALPSRLAAVTQQTAPEALSAAAFHANGPMRNDWSRDEIQSIYDSPLMDLLFHGVGTFPASLFHVNSRSFFLFPIGQGSP